jgi:hypothetical protein
MLFTLLTGILAAICGLIQPTIARNLTQNGLVERAIGDETGALHWFGEVIPGEGATTITGNDIEVRTLQFPRRNNMTVLTVSGHHRPNQGHQP